MFWTSVANVSCDKKDVEALTDALDYVKSGAGAADAYVAILEKTLEGIKKEVEKTKSSDAGPGRD